MQRFGGIFFNSCPYFFPIFVRGKVALGYQQIIGQVIVEGAHLRTKKILKCALQMDRFGGIFFYYFSPLFPFDFRFQRKQQVNIEERLRGMCPHLYFYIAAPFLHVPLFVAIFVAFVSFVMAPLHYFQPFFFLFFNSPSFRRYNTNFLFPFFLSLFKMFLVKNLLFAARPLRTVFLSLYSLHDFIFLQPPFL